MDIFDMSDGEYDRQENKNQSKKNKKKNNKKKEKWVFISDSDDSDEDWPSTSNYSVEEDIQCAIIYSLQTLEQETKRDKKNKAVIPSCTLSFIPFLDTSNCTSEMGSTSSLPTCLICHDVLQSSVRITPCLHQFCRECLSEYVGKSLKKNIYEVACPGPGCDLNLIKETVARLAPNEVHARWQEARTDGSVLACTMYITCPLEGCGRRIVDDERGYQIRACTACWRLFCNNCRERWHMGMTCQEYKWAEDAAWKRIRLRLQELERLKTKKRKCYDF